MTKKVKPLTSDEAAKLRDALIEQHSTYQISSDDMRKSLAEIEAGLLAGQSATKEESKAADPLAESYKAKLDEHDGRNTRVWIESLIRKGVIKSESEYSPQNPTTNYALSLLKGRLEKLDSAVTGHETEFRALAENLIDQSIAKINSVQSQPQPQAQAQAAPPAQPQPQAQPQMQSQPPQPPQPAPQPQAPEAHSLVNTTEGWNPGMAETDEQRREEIAFAACQKLANNDWPGDRENNLALELMHKNADLNPNVDEWDSAATLIRDDQAHVRYVEQGPTEYYEDSAYNPQPQPAAPAEAQSAPPPPAAPAPQFPPQQMQPAPQGQYPQQF